MRYLRNTFNYRMRRGTLQRDPMWVAIASLMSIVKFARWLLSGPKPQVQRFELRPGESFEIVQKSRRSKND